VKSPLEVGKAECRINWPRRFDFMQQHTGFHILARNFLIVTGARTLSSHLGEQISTIDVDLQEINNDLVRKLVLLIEGSGGGRPVLSRSGDRIKRRCKRRWIGH